MPHAWAEHPADAAADYCGSCHSNDGSLQPTALTANRTSSIATSSSRLDDPHRVLSTVSGPLGQLYSMTAAAGTSYSSTSSSSSSSSKGGAADEVPSFREEYDCMQAELAAAAAAAAAAETGYNPSYHGCGSGCYYVAPGAALRTTAIAAAAGFGPTATAPGFGSTGRPTLRGVSFAPGTARPSAMPRSQHAASSLLCSDGSNPSSSSRGFNTQEHRSCNGSCSSLGPNASSVFNAPLAAAAAPPAAGRTVSTHSPPVSPKLMKAYRASGLLLPPPHATEAQQPWGLDANGQMQEWGFTLGTDEVLHNECGDQGWCPGASAIGGSDLTESWQKAEGEVILGDYTANGCSQNGEFGGSNGEGGASHSCPFTDSTSSRYGRRIARSGNSEMVSVGWVEGEEGLWHGSTSYSKGFSSKRNSSTSGKGPTRCAAAEDILKAAKLAATRAAAAASAVMVAPQACGGFSDIGDSTGRGSCNPRNVHGNYDICRGASRPSTAPDTCRANQSAAASRSSESARPATAGASLGSSKTTAGKAAAGAGTAQVLAVDAGGEESLVCAEAFLYPPVVGDTTSGSSSGSSRCRPPKEAVQLMHEFCRQQQDMMLVGRGDKNAAGGSPRRRGRSRGRGGGGNGDGESELWPHLEALLLLLDKVRRGG